MSSDAKKSIIGRYNDKVLHSLGQYKTRNMVPRLRISNKLVEHCSDDTRRYQDVLKGGVGEEIKREEEGDQRGTLR
jgi:hypothetical protein